MVPVQPAAFLRPVMLRLQRHLPTLHPFKSTSGLSNVQAARCQDVSSRVRLGHELGKLLVPRQVVRVEAEPAPRVLDVVEHRRRRRVVTELLRPHGDGDSLEAGHLASKVLP